jgi:hypothetical protein
MAKKNEIVVKDVVIRTTTINGVDYISITDIARQKNSLEPKDVVKNWMRQKNTLEYLGLWERLHNPNFKGVEFDPLLAEAGSNSFTMSPTHCGSQSVRPLVRPLVSLCNRGLWIYKCRTGHNETSCFFT